MATAAATAGTARTTGCAGIPAAGSVQTLIVLSAPAETNLALSAAMPTPITGPSCDGTEAIDLPSAIFQTPIVLSSLAERTRSPRGVMSACRTGPAWLARHSSADVQPRADLSALAEKIRLPSP